MCKMAFKANAINITFNIKVQFSWAMREQQQQQIIYIVIQIDFSSKSSIDASKLNQCKKATANKHIEQDEQEIVVKL